MIRTLASRVTAWPRRAKRAVLLSFDFFALLGAVWLSYELRLAAPFVPSAIQIGLMLLAPAITVLVFLRFGFYRSVIRFLPERAIWTIIQATSLAVLIWVAVLFLGSLSGIAGVPRSVPLIYWAIAIIVVGGSRFAAKRLLGTHGIADRKRRPVLVFGASAEGVQIASALTAKGERWPVGLIDNDPLLSGRDMSGLRVYPASQLEALIANFDVKEVIFSPQSGNPTLRQEIIRRMAPFGVNVRTVPAFADLASQESIVRQIRDIQIDDLLGRARVPADSNLLREMVEGRVILVTGAGGSIGSELSRLIAKWAPARLVLLEANEFALFEIERKLELEHQAEIVPVLGSIADEALVRRTLDRHGVEVVLHTAAHKHVPLIEANVLEGVRNNVFGTLTIAEAALEFGVSHFVLISSDKAVRPSSVMGATKRWAELVVQDCAARAKPGQIFCSVRFGNVLGSSGSVVELFREQIARGGPVTLTHENMMRYFMSLSEAAELIVQAGALSSGGDVMLLDMGEPVPIRALAETMIRLSGLTPRTDDHPAGDINIIVTKPRQGEKLREELFYLPDETARPTRHPKILLAHGKSPSVSKFSAALEHLREALADEDEVRTRTVLFAEFVTAPAVEDSGDRLAGRTARRA
ncbi:MAG: nucleoside-diphosphate sugar epimerase/dehydratase [Cucumibacter sp.]